MNDAQLEEKYNGDLDKTHTKYRERNLKIQDDIYSYAFAALINPDVLEQLYTAEEKGKDSPFLQPKDLQSLTSKERSSVYQSALMVISIQITTICLLIIYFREDQETRPDPPKSYLILIPRLLSSFMMHLQVEQDIRNGLYMMKYAVNHPFMFTYRKSKKVTPREELIKIMTSRTILAFMLGFFQVTVSVVVEFLVIYYLSSIDELMKIIVKFVSLAKII